MLIVMRNVQTVIEVAVCDEEGVAGPPMPMPMPMVMLAVGQELDAKACRFLGTVRVLHQSWKEGT
jgi:hypothetical protein